MEEKICHCCEQEYVEDVREVNNHTNENSYIYHTEIKGAVVIHKNFKEKHIKLQKILLS